MTETAHQPCPFEDCGSSDAFSWNSDGYGKCHSCGKSYPSKGRTFDWAKKEYPVKDKTKLRDREVKSVTFEGIRGLDADVAKLYGIALQLDASGDPVRYAFKHKNNVKYRSHESTGEKEFDVKTPGNSMNDLFGPEFNSGSSKRLYITEGELDAASLFQVLGKTYPVLSLPSAGIGDPFLKKNHEYLGAFQEIVYAGELDKAGKVAAEKLYNVFPEKFWMVPMTKWKDANEFLTEGDGDDLKWAALKPQRYSPDNFFCSDADVEKAITEENPYEYIPTGLRDLDDVIRGLVKGGLTFIKAPRGVGKTEIARFFEMAMLKTETCTVALLHAEEMKSTTYRCMATYKLGKNVRTKEDAENNNVTEQEVIEAAKEMAGNERTVIFEMRSEDDPMKVLDYIRLAAAVYGAEYIFIDHIQRLAYLSDAGTDGATSTLTALGSRMAQMAKELNIGIVLLSQVNDDGRTKYAAALEEEAIICIKLLRDTDAEDENQKNTTEFYVDKNRPFSKLGDAGSVLWDQETTILKEKIYDV